MQRTQCVNIARRARSEKSKRIKKVEAEAAMTMLEVGTYGP